MAGVNMKQIRKVLDGLKGSDAVQWQGYTVAVINRFAVHKPLPFPFVRVMVSKPVPNETELVTWEGEIRDAAKVLFFNLNRKDS